MLPVVFISTLPVVFSVLLARLFSVTLPLIYGLAKIACFIVGCCHGIPYDGLFSVTYADGTPINANDPLLKGEKKKIRVRVRFKKEELQAEDLPDTQQVLNLKYKITYIEM